MRARISLDSRDMAARPLLFASLGPLHIRPLVGAMISAAALPVCALSQVFVGDVGTGMTPGGNRGPATLFPKAANLERLLTRDNRAPQSVASEVSPVSLVTPNVPDRGDQVDGMNALAGGPENGPVRAFSTGFGPGFLPVDAG